MDEQQIQQAQSQQIDIPQTQESDYQSEPEQLNIPQSDNLEQSEQNNEEEPEISITKDGEVKFRDDFFGDLSDEPNESQSQSEKTKQEDNSQLQQERNYYTDEELQNTPYEQWDFNRMPDEVKRYANFLNAQTLARQRQFEIQQQVMENSENPPYVQEVKQYTSKELAQDAEKLAVERLGLKSADDFDIYDSEHQAALNIAMQELANKRNNDIAVYEKQRSDYKQLQMLKANIEASPDFGEYREWFIKKAQSEGTTPELLNLQLVRNLQKNHDFCKIRDTVAGWYQLFLRERNASRYNPVSKNVQNTRKVSTPPKLESTRGGGYDSRRSVNLKNFGDLDPDAQAQALMDMGIV